MLLATEVTRTFTAIEFLFALFQGVVVVGTLLWVKLVLYRRREKEDEANRLLRRRKFAGSRTLRNSERRLRSRPGGVTAWTDRLLLGSRGMPLESSSATTHPTTKRRGY